MNSLSANIAASAVSRRVRLNFERRKIMKKITAICLIICLMSIYMTTPVSALINTNFLEKATIITEEEFVSVFNTNNIDDVSYDFYYETSQDNPYKAIAILEIALKIKGYVYNIFTSGMISLNCLDNGVLLWEGPLRGKVFIDDEQYSVIAGVAYLENSQESMISLTIQKDSTIVAISFGDSIIKDEVLNFYSNRSYNVNVSNVSDTSIANEIFTNNFSNGGISTCFISPEISEGIFDGGGGGSLNLGEDGEWKYKNVDYAKHGGTSYNALKSTVYFNSLKNVMMVTLKPFSGSTQNYVETLGYDFASSSLCGFGVELALEDADYPNYAYIANITKPDEAIAIDGYFTGIKVGLSPLFEDILGVIGVPTSTISAVLESMNGKIEIQESTLFASVDIEKDTFSDYEELDNISTGLPFRFQLSKGNHNLYEGDTPYVVNTYAKYYVFVQENVLFSEPAYYFFYIDVLTTHEGTVTLG